MENEAFEMKNFGSLRTFLKGILFGLMFICLYSCEEKTETPDPDPNHLNKDLVYGEIMDLEGNTYKTIQIGATIWMAENLRSTRFCNGDAINGMPELTTWLENKEKKLPAWVYVNNNPALDEPYGKLYNWYAVEDDRGLCPCDWEIPTEEEWNNVQSHLGDDSGGKMKTAGFFYWQSPNTGATNESGYSGLPGGLRTALGSFENFGTGGVWWTNNEFELDVFSAKVMALTYNSSDIGIGFAEKPTGLSVRCIKSD
jgi:uncharacterized protein (TIGR02145 family)